MAGMAMKPQAFLVNPPLLKMCPACALADPVLGGLIATLLLLDLCLLLPTLILQGCIWPENVSSFSFSNSGHAVGECARADEQSAPKEVRDSGNMSTFMA